MAKKKHNSKPARDVMAIARRAAFLLVALVVLVSAMMAYHSVGRFLIDDPRFAIPPPEVRGEPSPAIVLNGVVNASRDRVLSVFAEDAGRSLALLPARERRLQLLAVDWVRDASVTRIWPNTVRVQILERQPVAYVQLSAVGGSLVSEMALIDADGVLLGQVGKPYQLPVLRGISKSQSEPERAVRVRRGLKMLAAVGTLGDRLSEIDVSNPGNIRVVEGLEGQAVTLYLGRENFKSRLLHFHGHFPEIHRRYPNAKTFDLRIDDRITAMDGVESSD